MGLTYIVNSGEVEIIDCDPMGKEHLLGVLHPPDIFGEVGAICCRLQSYIYRTKNMRQILRLKTTTLIKEMQAQMPDNSSILNSFL
ncbi:potassium channel, voltage-dependent, EAG/ELK/ERG, Ankyrin repeat-containing domain protein [Artemisia annua]|uniref:Potassium channel n=1 Tax=Artemisia annua TaxID=35608 RepID=A0A2U1LWL4_ARTAN|nr:potassium channel, voltage-dependent, EAG/ELK/ERG, Ankyrin repeat-containing domain protein [Artemisia annua]